MHLNLTVMNSFIYLEEILILFLLALDIFSLIKYLSCFQNNQVFEIGISDLHDIVVKVIKLT